jgi:hypothetical protein
MKVMFPSKLFVLAAGLVLSGQLLSAQTSIQLFSAVNVRNSTSSTTYSNLATFNSSTISLTCPATGITAKLSGPAMNLGGTAPQTDESGNLQPGGNLLVDNVLLLTDTPQGGSAHTPVNVCANAGGLQTFSYNGQIISQSPTDLTWNCFTLGYGNAAGSLVNLANPDPDTTIVPGGTQTVDAAGGVPPIDISSDLVAGQQNVNIALVDGGGILTGSSIFLQTNCTFNGVGAGTIGGNPINGPQGSSQTFTFNPNTGGQDGVQFGYDVTGALQTLDPNSPPTTAIPQVSDMPLDKTKFRPVYSPGTSFATSNCLIHNGEVLADGITPACKLYTLACLSPTDGTVKGANCPISAQLNEVVQDEFDGPAFSLQNIISPYGIFREGMGFIMASEPWTGGNCSFDATSGLSTLACPQNLLTSFTGPGAFSGTGLTTNPNSTFLSIYGVPEDYTFALIQGQWPNHWVNTRTPSVKFFTQAPNFTKGAWTLTAGKLVSLPGASSYVPAPIKSLTFGVSPADNLPNPIHEPILGDITLSTSADCSAIPFTAKSVPNFSPAAQQLSFSSDGHFLLHYFAQDCAGTQELAFTQDGTGSWMTNFFTTSVNVDTQKPSVVGLKVPSPGSFKKGTTVYATYTCTDDASGAGVVLCGTSFFGTETTYTTSLLKTRLDTSSTGTKSVTIYALDGAGNLSSASVPYTVIN